MVAVLRLEGTLLSSGAVRSLTAAARWVSAAVVLCDCSKDWRTPADKHVPGCYAAMLETSTHPTKISDWIRGLRAAKLPCWPLPGWSRRCRWDLPNFRRNLRLARRG